MLNFMLNDFINLFPFQEMKVIESQLTMFTMVFLWVLILFFVSLKSQSLVNKLVS